MQCGEPMQNWMKKEIMGGAPPRSAKRQFMDPIELSMR
jgi:hypothetical protein